MKNLTAAESINTDCANRAKFAGMRALGATWRGFPQSCPTYPARMSQTQKDAADKLYDSMLFSWDAV